MRTVALLILSNIFMTFAWYAHLKHLREKPWLIAVFFSWGIAFFEYLLQVPANRMGYGQFSLPQLKVLQEIITMVVFGLYAAFYMRQAPNRDFFFATLCLGAAAYFMFRGRAA